MEIDSQQITHIDGTGREVIFSEGASPFALVEENHNKNSRTLLLLALLLSASVLVIWRFKLRTYRYLHETGVSMLIGMCAGMLVSLIETSNLDNSLDAAHCNETGQDNGHVDSSITIEKKTVFDPELFFYVLLPPIMFYAGYDLRQKHFFRNIGAISAFAFIGTTISCFVTGAVVYIYVYYIDPNCGLTLSHSMLFGALMSATDPVTVLAVFHDLHVDTDLYALVFGESCLNDAVALVLFSTINQYSEGSGKTITGVSFVSSIWIFCLVFFGSTAIGIIVGLFTALITKFTKIRYFPMLETTLFVLLSYSTFLLGEACYLTGIVAVLFCGMVQSHYTYYNLSDESKIRTKQFWQLFNFLSENFIFSYMGLSLFTFKCHQWNFGFIFWCLLSIVIARAAHIYPLSLITNMLRGKKSRKISFPFMHIMVFVGLRGAMAFALAIRDTTTHAQQLMFTATLVVVVFTVLVCGGATMATLQALRVRVGVDPDDIFIPPGHELPKLNKYGKWFVALDRYYLSPVVTHTKYNFGTDTYTNIKNVIKNYFKRIPYVIPDNLMPVPKHKHDDDDTASVDSLELKAEQQGDVPLASTNKWGGSQDLKVPSSNPQDITIPVPSSPKLAPHPWGSSSSPFTSSAPDLPDDVPRRQSSHAWANGPSTNVTSLSTENKSNDRPPSWTAGLSNDSDFPRRQSSTHAWANGPSTNVTSLDTQQPPTPAPTNDFPNNPPAHANPFLEDDEEVLIDSSR